MTQRTAWLAGLLALAGCALSGLNRYTPNLYSIQGEISLGQRLSREIEKELRLLHHPVLDRLVGGTGERLLATAAPAEFRLFPFEFHIVDSAEINAFSLPGGAVYVNTGMIEMAEAEDELASVIAHEMAHVAARHATERLSTLQLTNLVASVALIATGGGGLSATALEGARLAYVLGVLRYTRGMESEADRIGLDLMSAAGYDPRAMVALLVRMDERHASLPSLLERLLSSHPITKDRIAAARSWISGRHLEPPRRPPSPDFVMSELLFGKD